MKFLITICSIIFISPVFAGVTISGGKISTDENKSTEISQNLKEGKELTLQGSVPLHYPLIKPLPSYSGKNCFEGKEHLIDNLRDKGRPPKKGKEDLTKCLVENRKSIYPPLVFAGKAVNKNAIDDVIDEIKIAMDTFGNFGPVHLYLVAINDPDAKKLAESYCLSMINSKSRENFKDCFKETFEEEFSKYDCCGAAHDPASPFNIVRYQSVKFSGPNISSSEGRIIVTAIHEYIHAYQNSFSVWGS